MWICELPNEIRLNSLMKKKWNHYNLYTYIIVNQRWIRAGFGSQIGAWVIMYKEWVEMAMGRVWDRSLLSHSHHKIYSYFPFLPKPSIGRGMYSHPHFETITKIPSPPCLDLAMCFWINKIRNQGNKILDIQKKKINLSLTKKKRRLGIEEYHGSPKET